MLRLPRRYSYGSLLSSSIRTQRSALVCCLVVSVATAFSRGTSIHRFSQIYNNPTSATRAARQQQIMSFSSQTETNESFDEQNVQDPLTLLGLPSPLILGSGSFTRKLILEEMNVKFHLLVRSIDEHAIGDRTKGDARSLVKALATAKGNHLVQLINSGEIERSDMPANDSEKSWIILTADQVVTHEDRILEKPISIEEAKKFIRGYAESPPKTVGACVLTHVPSGIQISGVDSATIHFKKSVALVDGDGKDLVDLLRDEDAPILSCAGGLMVEHPLVTKHIEHIDGTQDSVMGLAKHLVLQLLEEMRERLQRENVS